MAVLYGIGAGCGDPSDMTVKAIDRLDKCDVVVFPAGSRDRCRAYDIVQVAVPQIVSKELRFFDFPMTRDRDELKKRRLAIYAEVKSFLQGGHDVGFVTIGDPLIYSTFSYIAALAEKDGYSVEVINGVPSFMSCAAQLELILGRDDEEIHIIPGTADIRAALRLPGMKVFMKIGRHLDVLERVLEETPGHTFLGAVTDCGMPEQKIYEKITDIPKKDAYLMTAFVR